MQLLNKRHNKFDNWMHNATTFSGRNPGIAPVANPNTILTLTLTLTWGLILDNALLVTVSLHLFHSPKKNSVDNDTIYFDRPDALPVI